MLFNSYEFIFLFLPISLVVYLFLNSRNLFTLSRLWLFLASLFFYGWWDMKYVLLILASILFNYMAGTALLKNKSRPVLVFGICANVLLLFYYKYVDFFIYNINYLTGLQASLFNIVLPLGISFFTFTQIAFLVDSYRDEAKEYSLLNYCLFVTFFPHLLAGPIIHHKEMMPQFEDTGNKSLNYRNLSLGISLFFIGLFKKVVIADTLLVYANNGFDITSSLQFIEAWQTSLSYTFQLYFDFSGYTDMALGSALMFNIVLPVNFNSPYKALNIQDFWKRWHMTLSRFLRDYIYIPLGGSRLSGHRTLINLTLVFLIGGLWHGVGWLFVIWGGLHGLATVIHKLWGKLNLQMPKALAWFLTFNFVNITWVFFRAKSVEDALKVLKGMFGLNGFGLHEIYKDSSALLKDYNIKLLMKNTNFSEQALLLILLALLVSLLFRNSNELAIKFKPNFAFLIIAVFLTAISVLYLGKHSEFLYFRF